MKVSIWLCAIFLITFASATPPVCHSYNSTSLSADETVEGVLTPINSVICYNFTLPGSMDEGVLKVVMNYTVWNEDVCVNVQDYNEETDVTTPYSTVCESGNATQVQMCNGGEGNTIEYQTDFYIVVWCSSVINCNSTAFSIYWNYEEGPELSEDCSETTEEASPDGGIPTGWIVAMIVGAVIVLLLLLIAAVFLVKRAREHKKYREIS